MTTKVLIAIAIAAALALILVVFSEPGGRENVVTQTADETFVERAVRTRLNADAVRFEAEESDETVLERAVRTRAAELVERVNSEP